jgi:hypothetical protein
MRPARQRVRGSIQKVSETALWEVGIVSWTGGKTWHISEGSLKVDEVGQKDEMFRDNEILKLLNS